MRDKTFRTLAFFAWAALAPAAALADCADTCSARCDGYSDPQQWDACMYPCLQACTVDDPPSVPDASPPAPAD